MAKENEMKDVQSAPAEAEVPQISQREQYDRDFAQMNPGLDMEDEEAVYGARNKMLGKLKNYDESTKRLKDTMKKSPMFSEAIGAIADSEGDFDLIQWLSSKKGVDIKRALEDEEYAKSVTDGYNKHLADIAEQNASDEKAKSEFTTKANESLDAIYAWDEGRKVSPEQTKKNLQQVTTEIEAYIHGDYLPLYQKLSKGTTYDEDMANAKENGRKEGLGTKVQQKIRQMPTMPERNGGRQQQVAEAKPQKVKKKNPYLEEDDEWS